MESKKKVSNVTVYIDPTSQIFYASFYIHGLREVFGSDNVFFSKSRFAKLRRHEGRVSFDVYFAFVIIDDGVETRYVVDFADDASDINRSAYQWCHKYAKVNVNRRQVISSGYGEYVDYDRVINIPPGFGLRIWNFWLTVYCCVRNLVLMFPNYVVPPHIHVKDYMLQYFRRLPLVDYISLRTSDRSGIFFVSKLWDVSNCISTTNQIRMKFVCLCQSLIGDRFEGGFLIPENHPNRQDYIRYELKSRYSMRDYLKRMASSMVAFNTPAVHYCHGWKLGEYFCLGMPIVSTEFKNELPVGMRDRVNIHFSEIDKLEDDVSRIVNDPGYRRTLSEGALNYWDSFVSPKAVIEYIVNCEKFVRSTAAVCARER